MRYQSGTSKRGAPSRPAVASGKRGGRRYLPYAFTEHGTIMAANVLNSPRAVQMNTTCGDAVGWTALVTWRCDRAIGRSRVNVFVVRAFLKMRALLGDKRELARQLAALEKELKERLDVHEAAIVTILQRVMDIIDPPSLPPAPAKPKIGFRP